MQRFSVTLIAAVIAVFGSASVARASTIQDIFDPSNVLFGKQSDGICTGDNTTDTVSGQDATGCFSLLYSIILTGYTNPPDSLVSASLDLYLLDDTDPGNNPETVSITLDGNLEGQYSVANSPFNFDVFASVSPDGLLNVFLERGTKGSGQADFYFDKGILNAEWRDGETNTVPEPTTMALMGTGAAMAAYRRRRKAKPQRTT
jgi:hypothetical protein